ncbi:MAG: hypothetical protein QM762_00100 [Chryseolinea sp.]
MKDLKENLVEIDADAGRVFLKTMLRASWVALLAAAIYQFVFFPEIVNSVAVIAVAGAWLITSIIWLKFEMQKRFLFSAFMLLGFVSSQFYFALLFTSMEGKAITYNLELPEEVFLHSSICLLVLILAHSIYRYLNRLSFDRSSPILERLGFFTPPTHLQVWIMGGLGMAASFYVYFTAPDVGREITGSSSDKLIQGLVPFSYAPFFIAIARIYGNNEKPHRGYIPMIIGYSILLFAVSIARNSRGAFIVGLTTPVFAYFLGLILGVFKTKVFTLKNFAIGGALAWLLLGPFTDLGTAMLIVRNSRSDLAPGELLSETLDALDDKQAIEQRKKDDADASMDFDWDERYLNNLFAARFANIKFNDMNQVTAQKVGTYDPDMQQFSLDQIVSIFPDPVIKFFGFDVDKEEVLAMSFGDFQYILSGGYGTPFGYRVGNLSASGMTTFGWWYLLCLGLISMPVFYLNDKLINYKARIGEDGVRLSQLKVSFCGILLVTHFFQFYLVESVVQILTYIVRGWLQMILLYFIMFQLSRGISWVITSRKKPRKETLAYN